MALFRQYIAPLIILLGFIFALVAVSARSFLPGDMLEPATPIGQATRSEVTRPEVTRHEPIVAQPPISSSTPSPNALPPQLSLLVHGDAPAL